MKVRMVLVRNLDKNAIRERISYEAKVLLFCENIMRCEKEKINDQESVSSGEEDRRKKSK